MQDYIKPQLAGDKRLLYEARKASNNTALRLLLFGEQDDSSNAVPSQQQRH